MLAAAIMASTMASWATPASATMRISEDRGGQIGHYLQAFAMLRSSGERVVIDGNCLSACTLLLGLIPRSRMCATDRARLGFHAAWTPDADGRPVTSVMGTRALWNNYPRSVRHWISRHGGLSRKMIYMQGAELYAFVPSCEHATRQAHARSRHRYRAHRIRYNAANAASYRR
jgi:hypothetical protein